jgi:hypothetical protein
MGHDQVPEQPTNKRFLTQTGEFLRVAVHLVGIEGLSPSNRRGQTHAFGNYDLLFYPRSAKETTSV